MSPHAQPKTFEEGPAVDLAQFPDRIAETFAGKTVFLTGATGFVGRAMVEKLLHNTEVKKIYLLIKSKRGRTTQERFLKYFDDPIFSALIKDFPESPKKVEVIPGDLSHHDLGISQEDREKLINEVQFIYHGGASVRFDEFIKRMVLLNVRGTRNMICLAKEVKNLELFVQISTTYCQPRDVILKEEASIPPGDPHEMIKIVENVDESALNILTQKIVDVYGNTYTWSKALAEAIVFEHEGQLPVMVVRPSIILPCWQHPIPGFTDSEYGAMGTWILAIKGLFHVTQIPKENCLEYVTLDMVISTIFITTYNYINNTEQKVIVCNSTNLSLDTHFVDDVGLKANHCTPLDLGLGYTWYIVATCPFIYWFLFYLTQLLPAVLIDGLMHLRGLKSKRSLVEIQRKIARTWLVIEFYAHAKKWHFDNETIRNLRLDLNEREDVTYPLNVEDIDWFKYGKMAMHHVRTLILKEKMEDLPRAKVMLKRSKIVHHILQGGLICSSLWFAWNVVLPLCVRGVYYLFDFEPILLFSVKLSN